ncbi:mitogen-activated protein kinase kinase kinase 20 isoform 5-T6 [Vipera latastei]
MSMYASLFKEHHITGKRLLLLEEEDLKDMGIFSKGHIIHLKTAIEKLCQDFFNMFHFPPLIKDSASENEASEVKVLNLELVFGYHLKPGKGPQDCKWKMYMEMDGDEIAITYIKDVTFNTNLPDVEILKMTKPPFVMEKWIVGIGKDQTVECIVTYEADVHTPKSTKHIQQVQWNQMKQQDEVKSVQLKIQTSLPNVEGNPRSRSNSSIDCQWMNALKMHRVTSSPSLQHSRPHSPNNLTHFLPYLHNQDTYAAAVRRTSVPTTFHITPLIQSRSSSPTTYLSSLHLNSKGSSSSSATSTSDSPSERGSSKSRNRNNHHSSVSPGGAAAGKRFVRNPTAPGTLRNAGKYPRSSQSTFNQYQHLPRTHERKHTHYPQQFKSIPGMPLKTEAEEEEEESKVSEGGWVKVNYSKKSYRQTVGKQNKEKSKGTGALQRKSR